MRINPRPAVNLLLDAAANRPSSAAAPSAGLFRSAGSSAAPAATRGDSLFLAIEGELQRIDQGRQLLRQVKADLDTLRVQLQSPEDESVTDVSAAALRSSIAGIQLGLLDLASLRPPTPADAREKDPVNEIGSIINGLDPESLAEPTSADATADALAQVDAALALADALGETLDSERQQATALHPLSALAPQSDADALLLAKAIADGLRNTTDALGSRKPLSTTV